MAGCCHTAIGCILLNGGCWQAGIVHPSSLNFDSLATDVDIATIVNRCGKTKFDELDVHNAGQIEGLAALGNFVRT